MCLCTLVFSVGLLLLNCYFMLALFYFILINLFNVYM